jgi:hypothetical protein
LVVAAALSASALPVFAADKTTLSSVLAASDITVSGRVDASYDYADTEGGAAPAFGNFNTESNSFALHQVGLRLAKAPAAGVGGAVTLLIGEDAKAVNAANGDGASSFATPEAYLSYTMGATNIMAGRLLTLAGAEVIDSSANLNATRGLVFAIQPFLHTGVRASHKLSDSLTVTGGVMNSIGSAGVDSISSNRETKALELNAAFPLGSIANSVTLYVGDEAEAKDAGFSSFLDTVSSVAVNDKLNLVLNLSYGNSEDSSDATSEVFGAAAYANYKLAPKCRIAGRLEQLHVASGGDASAFTFTYGHTVTDGLELMTEVRYDDYSSEFASVFGEDNQVIGTLKAVYKF